MSNGVHVYKDNVPSPNSHRRENDCFRVYRFSNPPTFPSHALRTRSCRLSYIQDMCRDTEPLDTTSVLSRVWMPFRLSECQPTTMSVQFYRVKPKTLESLISFLRLHSKKWHARMDSSPSLPAACRRAPFPSSASLLLKCDGHQSKRLRDSFRWKNVLRVATPSRLQRVPCSREYRTGSVQWDRESPRIRDDSQRNRTPSSLLKGLFIFPPH